MPAISTERLVAELQTHTDYLAELAPDADLRAPVPTCPEWTMADLLAHVGRSHRRVAAIVSRGVMVHLREVEDAVLPDAPGARAEWLRAGARLLADSVSRVGPESPTWSWFEDQRAGFWLRRMTHDTTVHHADAALACGAEWMIAPDLAADGISEWLAILASPRFRGSRPAISALDGQGQTLHFHATDGDLGEDGEWLVRRDPDGIRWSHEHLKADVVVRCPAGALLLTLMRRIPATDPQLTVFGEGALLDHWLANSAF